MFKRQQREPSVSSTDVVLEVEGDVEEAGLVDRRGALSRLFLTGVGVLTAGVAGADIGARIRRDNDAERERNEVAGLVAAARQEAHTAAVDDERYAAMLAMTQVMELTADLNAARGERSYFTRIIQGTVTDYNLKGGARTFINPLIFGDFTTDRGSRYIACQSATQGLMTFDVEPLTDDMQIELAPGSPGVVGVQVYTARKGGPDSLTPIWAASPTGEPLGQVGLLSFSEHS